MRRLEFVFARLLPLAVLVTALVGAPVMILAPEGLPRLRGLERELASVHEENAQIEREIEALRGKVTRLRDDPAAVERIARDHLGMVRQTEVVFQFPAKR
jgi:cell division protein FtsB